jgi:regulator of sigma E protease
MISFLPVAFVAFILGFGFLVFIHELGHFLVAKWVGIRCTQFAIGFGPAMLSWRKGLGLRVGSTEAEYEKRAVDAFRERGADPEKATPEQLMAAADRLGMGETEYRLNYLPLGGYVKMLGQEDIDPAARSMDPRSFNSKSVGARFAVISAGVIMNLITGVIFFVIAFMAGVEFPPAIVGGTQPGMPAAQAYAIGHEGDPAFRGLRVGDRITHINDREIMDFVDVRIASALASRDESMDLTVQRPGHGDPLVFRVTPRMDTGERLLSLGIAPPWSTRIISIERDGPLHQQGLRADMDVVQVGGRPVEGYPEFHRAVTAARGEPVEALFRNAETGEQAVLSLRALPPLPRADTGDVHLAGLLPATRIVGTQKGSPAEAAGVQPGDLVAELGGVPWPGVEELRRIVGDAGGQPLEMVVWRDGQTVPLGTIRPARGLIGVSLVPNLDEPIVAKAAPGSPAASLDLYVGSRILAINDQPVDSWNDLFRLVASLDPAGQDALPLNVRFRKHVADGVDETAELAVPAALIRQLRAGEWRLPDGLFFDIRRDPVQAANPWEATVLGLVKTRQFIQQAYVMILRLMQRTVQVEHLRGPIGIVDEGTRIARGGWSYLFYFLGLLSINLAVINFLPIPIADGGHAVFLLAEKIKGSPVSARVQVGAMYVGLLLIGGIFLLVTYHDLVRLVPGLGG